MASGWESEGPGFEPLSPGAKTIISFGTKKIAQITIR